MGEDRVGVLDTSCDQQGRASSGAGMRAGVSLRRAGVQAHSALHRLHSEEGPRVQGTYLLLTEE